VSASVITPSGTGPHRQRPPCHARPACPNDRSERDRTAPTTTVASRSPGVGVGDQSERDRTAPATTALWRSSGVSRWSTRAGQDSTCDNRHGTLAERRHRW